MISDLVGLQIATPLWWGRLYFESFWALLFHFTPSLYSRLSFVTHLLRFEAYPNTSYIRVKLSCMSSSSSVCCPLYVLTTSPHLHSASIIMYP